MFEKRTLSTGKYLVEFSEKGFEVLSNDEGRKEWICTTGDPATAMNIVEGLILVEMKRFYHPEAAPVINNNPVPPFLKRQVQ